MTTHGDNMIGRFIDDRYRIDFRIGGGGIADVYGARDVFTDRTVALKILRNDVGDPAARERFLLEAESMGRIESMHVARLYGFGRDMPLRILYIAMELVSGYDLSVLVEEGRLPLSLALDVMSQTAAGLDDVHEHDLLHRDVKPANLKLVPEGRDFTVKILDLGLARLRHSVVELTAHGMAPGTVGYMSPETLSEGPVDYRTDLYSLGVVGYQMLTGRLPFDGESTVEVAEKHLDAEPAPLADALPDVPPPVAEFVHRLLAKDPDDRPRSAAVVWKKLGDLRRALEIDSYQLPPGGDIGEVRSDWGVLDRTPPPFGAGG